MPFGVFLIIIFLGGLFYLSSPRLAEIEPVGQATQVPGSTSIRLRFTRMMDPASVTARLKISPSQMGQVTWENNTLIFTPQKPWQSGATVKVSLGKGSWALHFPRLTMLNGKEWSFTIGSPKILYLYPLDSPAAPYLLDPLFGKQQNLTLTVGEILDFSVSPNGAQIWMSVRTDQGSAIYSMDGIAGTPSLVRTFPAGQVLSPVLSPSLRYLAFGLTNLHESQSETHIWLLDFQDNPEWSLIQLPDGGSQVQYPLWSTKNILAYYDQTSMMYRFYDPQIKSEIGSVACQTGGKASWSPDGQSFVFAEIVVPPDEGIPSSHLLLYDLFEKKMIDLTQSNNVEDAAAQFAPDGGSLIFARKYLDPLQWTPGRQIWMMDVKTFQTRALLLEAQYNHYDFSWSPDGTQVAYMRFNQMDPTAPSEIWLIQRDGSQNQRLVSGGYSPQWVP